MNQFIVGLQIIGTLRIADGFLVFILKALGYLKVVGITEFIKVTSESNATFKCI